MRNLGVVIHVVGVLLAILGGFMLTGIPFSFYFGDDDASALFYSALTAITVGVLLWGVSRKSSKNIGKRQGFLIVSLGWISISLFSALPYLYADVFDNPANALFEAVSGLTTTGASVINDIEALPKGVLFWRSLTQWIGGMGVIVLTVALFPLLGVGGVELFIAEAPGPTSDKIHPRIKETAKRLWMIYCGLTGLLTILLTVFGMNFYEAINHALTTMATGGFSTRNASIAAFPNPLIQYTLTLFMLIAGVNYTIIYFGLKGRLSKVWQSEEFRSYIGFVGLLTLIVFTVIVCVTNTHPEKAFRDAAFQIVSLITTTGFVSADYTAWASPLTFLFFLMLFSGGCAGSTSGGIKIIRHVVIFKNSFLELKRLIHPKAIIRTKIDKKLVAPKIMTHILGFLLLYIFIFIAGSIVMTIFLRDFEQPLITAIGAVATSLGNVGPAIGELGPTDNFAAIPSNAKVFLSFLMLLGRLELFSVLVLFTPYFWQKS